MRRDPNGLPYYMDHQVWNKDFDDPRGIGGDDQFHDGHVVLASFIRLYGR